MVSTDDARDTDDFPDAPGPADPDGRVKWDCFSCGGFLGEQGSGADFTLGFGYGSSYDGTRNVCGWICDECVTQKHGRLLVRVDPKRRDGFWSPANYVPLAEHEETRKHVAHLDFFGRRHMPWGFDHRGEPYESTGDRRYEVLTAQERSRVEAWLFREDEPVDRDLVVKLLHALMASEAQCALERSKRWRAEMHALDRARHQAARMSAEELAQLRAREQADLSPADWGRLWEHTQWNENHFREQQERIRAQAEEITSLRAQTEALKKRLGPG